MADFIDAVTLRSVPRSHIGLGLEVVRLIEEVESELARAPGEMKLGLWWGVPATV